ncbi:hypothetical protein BGY98DRAFT_946731, partial [Russula aff. rugulosa BPL654]
MYIYMYTQHNVYPSSWPCFSKSGNVAPQVRYYCTDETDGRVWMSNRPRMVLVVPCNGKKRGVRRKEGGRERGTKMWGREDGEESGGASGGRVVTRWEEEAGRGDSELERDERDEETRKGTGGGCGLGGVWIQRFPPKIPDSRKFTPLLSTPPLHMHAHA